MRKSPVGQIPYRYFSKDHNSACPLCVKCACPSFEEGSLCCPLATAGASAEHNGKYCGTNDVARPGQIRMQMYTG